MLSKISAIVAMSKNRVIGKNNQLPWHLPADLQHFKKITTGHAILMGRKTYESIGRPLPNRTNLIMTRNPDFTAPNCIIVPSIESALECTANEKEIFIIGGANIYEQWLPYLERIYLTIVLQEFTGDAHFPELNSREWDEVEKEEHAADEKNSFAYQFLVLERTYTHSTSKYEAVIAQ